MAIKGPKGAHPTLKGWVHPKTGELLKSQRIPQSHIDEFFGTTKAVVETVAPVVEEVVVEEVAIEEEIIEDVNEDGTIDEIESMTKAQIAEYAMAMGIELDRRQSKSSMITELKALMNA